MRDAKLEGGPHSGRILQVMGQPVLKITYPDKMSLCYLPPRYRSILYERKDDGQKELRYGFVGLE